jgi:hypothetical protein
MWTAIFTGVLSVLTVLTYQVTQISSETARATDRAFLNFAGPTLGVRLVDPGGVWGGYEIGLNWNNSGNTPTRWAVIRANGQIWPGDLPAGFNFPLTQDRTVTVLGPKAVYGTTVTAPRNLWVQAWHGARFFVWGSVLYKDIFPKDPERLTEFCAEIYHITAGTPPQPPAPQGTRAILTPPPATVNIEDPQTPIVGFQWKVCLEHSCYDGDCKDYADRRKDMQP